LPPAQAGPCCSPPVSAGQEATCCPTAGPAAASDSSGFGQANYGGPRVAGLPEDAVHSSLGCGDPTLFADLHAGEYVLDLGSGGGLDAFLAARAVGPTGFVYGVDMTDEMLALARRNQAASGLSNVAFVRGFLEDLPFDDSSFDVVISNCVINLVSDKDLVLRECFRVLRPGGLLAVSDTVLTSPIDPAARADRSLWSCCVAGAMAPDEYRTRLQEAGFAEISVDVGGEQVIGGLHVASARVRARKPSPEPQATIRPARPDDVAEITRLLESAGLPAAGLDETDLLVAELDGSVAASAGLEWHGSSALLRSVAVQRPWRGQGLGRKIVASALDQARKRGAAGVYLLTTTAARFFEGSGFVVADRSAFPPELSDSAEMRGHCPATAVAMALTGI
jgi:N-acetylglutamate synthase-like GNAT family acetyltransferase